ncbi:MAG: redoxin domain-containing protein [Cellvibrionaceae bacterium]|nr:redoxin domain-containing protein [Cellvibrionaceae bacterium]MCV6627193.1 redoxin domain-containing protein [Cellvibrionaceae bacterium]
MEFLVISNIALWIGLIIMGVINYALIRQIGVLYERVAPAGALAMNQNLEVGQAAPELALQALGNGLINVGGAQGKAQLLFFLSPDCPVCKSLLPAIKSAAKAEADWLQLVFGSDGNNYDHHDYIKQQGLEDFPYIVSELLGKTYGVAKLPYGVLIDERGKVASMGIVNSREHVDSLFEAKERQVASIQDYMAKR